METGQLDRIMVYCQKGNYFSDWGFLLTIIVCAREEEAWVMFGSSSQPVKEAMQSFIKANDATEYVAVCHRGRRPGGSQR